MKSKDLIRDSIRFSSRYPKRRSAQGSEPGGKPHRRKAAWPAEAVEWLEATRVLSGK
jgi:hypothetical protein